MTAAGAAAALNAGVWTLGPAAVVVAHPDDEVLGLGDLLGVLRPLTIVQLTDGAPADMADARSHGFATPAAYAAAREAERQAAMAGIAHVFRPLGYVDKETAYALPALIATLTGALAGQAVVVTHPYEGGHPDHDSAAFAVARACAALGRHAPLHLEFAGYHLGAGGLRFGAFWPGEAEGHAVPLTPEQRAATRRRRDAYVTQAATIGNWLPDPVRLRTAPAYDFARPPPPGQAWYDRYGWAMTSARWRERAAAC